MDKMMKPSTLEKRKFKAKKREIMNNDEASTSSSCSSSSTSNPNSTRIVSRVARRLRNPTMRLGMARRSVGERQAEALALSLGMSFAAFTNLVLERKSAADQNVHVDDLAVVSTSVVKEALVSVYGEKLGSFATRFEKSFKSTLKILKVTNESAFAHYQLNNNNVASFNLDPSTIEGSSSDTELTAKETSSTTSTYETVQGGARPTSSMNELVLNEDTRQLSTMSLTTFEQRSLEEKARANDLSYMKNFLTVRKLCLKEAELVQMEESNNLKKIKIEMDVSKAAFKAEKFSTQKQDTRKDEMVTVLNDWLVTSVYIMLIAMVYGAYMFSQQRIMECEPSSSEEDESGWVPKQVSLLHTEFNFLICRLRVWIPSSFSVLMILIFTYFIIQRSSGMKQAMPVSFIVVFLGVFCGLIGKFSVDTLGCNGKLWLILWEVFCALQLAANVYMLPLHGLIYGPTQGTMVPYRARRVLFFGLVNLLLPVIIGFLPFAATFGE
ncbi:unnamed protein product [Microthlaspi erraticum]|uniref:Uncharacterized protein n=1 Tax=Microthlaspi erraticum TaxID=1685480 RepID=A0A6D2L6G6_9BRAS|nr:unnamed protein product [Microthlaspi erraticum]